MCDVLDFKVNKKSKLTLFTLLEHQGVKVGPNEDERHRCDCVRAVLMLYSLCLCPFSAIKINVLDMLE